MNGVVTASSIGRIRVVIFSEVSVGLRCRAALAARRLHRCCVAGTRRRCVRRGYHSVARRRRRVRARDRFASVEPERCRARFAHGRGAAVTAATGSLVISPRYCGTATSAAVPHRCPRRPAAAPADSRLGCCACGPRRRLSHLLPRASAVGLGCALSASALAAVASASAWLCRIRLSALGFRVCAALASHPLSAALWHLPPLWLLRRCPPWLSPQRLAFASASALAFAVSAALLRVSVRLGLRVRPPWPWHPRRPWPWHPRPPWPSSAPPWPRSRFGLGLRIRLGPGGRISVGLRRASPCAVCIGFVCRALRGCRRRSSRIRLRLPPSPTACPRAASRRSPTWRRHPASRPWVAAGGVTARCLSLRDLSPSFILAAASPSTKASELRALLRNRAIGGGFLGGRGLLLGVEHDALPLVGVTAGHDDLRLEPDIGREDLLRACRCPSALRGFSRGVSRVGSSTSPAVCCAGTTPESGPTSAPITRGTSAPQSMSLRRRVAAWRPSSACCARLPLPLRFLVATGPLSRFARALDDRRRASRCRRATPRSRAPRARSPSGAANRRA